MPKYETINVKPKTKATISRLSKKHEQSLVDFTEQMAIYFDKTGVNPRDQKVLSPAEELKKFRDTIISFLRTQEKDFILPVFGQMEMLMARFFEYLDKEAPRRSGQEIPVLDTGKKEGDLKTPPDGPSPKSLAIEEVNKDKSEELSKIKNDLEREKSKLMDFKKEMQKIFDNTQIGSTGFNKKLIIEISEAEFNDLKKYFNRL